MAQGQQTQAATSHTPAEERIAYTPNCIRCRLYDACGHEVCQLEARRKSSKKASTIEEAAEANTWCQLCQRFRTCDHIQCSGPRFPYEYWADKQA